MICLHVVDIFKKISKSNFYQFNTSAHPEGSRINPVKNHILLHFIYYILFVSLFKMFRSKRAYIFQPQL